MSGGEEENKPQSEEPKEPASVVVDKAALKEQFEAFAKFGDKSADV